MTPLKQFFYIFLLLQCLTSVVYPAGVLEGRHTGIRFEGVLRCNVNGIVKGVPLVATLSHKASCNGLFNIANFTIRLVINDGVYIVPKTNPVFILDFNDGKIFGTWYYEIDEGYCRGGVGFAEIKYEDTDPRACTSRHGLSRLEGIPIFYEVRGGKCEIECSGEVVAHFSPGLIDYGF